MMSNIKFSAGILALSIMVASCGGGADDSETPPITDPTNQQRAAAANTTVETNPLCSVATLQSYYWEIGNKDGVLISGSRGPASITANTPLNIASASKWPFAAYVLEKYGSSAVTIPFLNFTSGYSNFDNGICDSAGTVGECMNGGVNATEAAAGTFHYQGGHMQQLAVNLGLGGLRNDSLASEVRSGIGNDIGLVYAEPLPPGGIRTSAHSYSLFLRKLLVGSSSPLRMGEALGTNSVCTQPSANCNASQDAAAALPESLHYSLGHWVEDDPAFTPASNFAYSSGGKFGFYPWVSMDRTLYGIIAREDPTLVNGEGYSSLQCGRLIRLAWRTAVVQ